MKYFLDTEFIDDGRTIDLISIGIVSEDGREYYACNVECDLSKANDWVKANVLPNLSPKHLGLNPSNPDVSPSVRHILTWKTKDEIVKNILNFCLWRPSGFVPYDFYNLVNISNYDRLEPEFWGEWCSYDWVAFCQLFGTMMDLPIGFPMRCKDVIQMAEDDLTIQLAELPLSLEEDGNHHALLGARTVKARWEYCNARKGSKLRLQ